MSNFSSKVALRTMYSNSFSLGSGGYGFKGHYEVIVQNTAYHKKLSILTDHASWKPIAGEFEESLPNNLEKWIVPASEGQHDFSVRYEVDGKEYFDNNDGKNYQAPQVSGGFSIITGKDFPVVYGASSLINSKLRVHAAVQDLGDNKEVGLVYSTDNWQTQEIIQAGYNWTQQSGIEVWLVEQSFDITSDIEFALYYKVNGMEFWDNNFSRNYLLSPQTLSAKKALKNDIWDVPAKASSQKSKKKQEPEAAEAVGAGASEVVIAK